MVKPYAVVEINEQWVRQNMPSAGDLIGKSSPGSSRWPQDDLTHAFSQWQPLARSRFASCASLLPSRSPPRDGSADKRRRIIPKRKAPPPPDRPPARMLRAVSAPAVHKLCSDQVEGGAVCSSHYEMEALRAKSPPRKPPRTQSTFITDFSDLLLSTAAAAKASREVSIPSPPRPHPQPNEYEPLTRPLLGTSVPHITKSVAMVPHQVVDLFDNTLAEVATHHLQHHAPQDIPWEVAWAELTMCTDELGQQHLYYHNGHTVVVEVSPSD